MKRMCLPALLSVVLVATARLVGAQNLSDLDSCIARLEPQADIGYERVAARCPDLTRQLELGAWSAWLPRGWKDPGNDLSAGSLRELRELATQEQTNQELTASASERTPDVRGLKRVLARLDDTRSEGNSRWARFRNWLRSLLASRESTQDGGWLSGLISNGGFPQAVLELFAYAALAVVVLLAAVIVISELRIAGLLAARPVRGRRSKLTVQSDSLELSWLEVERAALAEKPRLLLQLIAGRLTAMGFLPPSGSLTVREISRFAALTESQDRTCLADLALMSESVRYSGRDLPLAGQEWAVVRGRELLDRLEAKFST